MPPAVPGLCFGGTPGDRLMRGRRDALVRGAAGSFAGGEDDRLSAAASSRRLAAADRRAQPRFRRRQNRFVRGSRRYAVKVGGAGPFFPK